MILEHAWLTITEGREAEFESAMAKAFAGAEVRRVVESLNYVLIVKWDSVEVHMEGFRTSPLFEEWRAATHHFYSEKPHVIHYSEPIAR
ncbi:MAG: antibiotic biosynthesis monooxygenase [Actinobacteria bacterium]|nr:antibiotic biosynthesis monooxygenase [Actinomycetota bacterium]